jgi:hypothetical protein
VLVFLVLEECPASLGEQDLAAVPCVADPLRPVDGEAVVAVGARRSLARVDAHADPDLDAFRPAVGLQRTLTRHGRAYGVARSPKAEEERVALGVDLRAAEPFECVAEEALMLGEHLRVPITKLA